ncbi:MliC family protein [Phenylobacterium sp. J426]|uniref:MliC family protein n=1 Tax=Phenylobacterium sp. J426 TaxID=2898439 RepID=UPI00215101D5|nr:MliC family protein [Phenylobacterium sp. J426]MCR5875610.1 MliC family protein [Phenylobacterium sp. J426]
MRALLILSALAVAACQPKAGAPEEDVEVSRVILPEPDYTRYTCEDGQSTQVKYVGQDQATVSLGQRTLHLKRAVSASGARYTGGGLQWWSKGDQGFRAPLKPGEDVASATPVLCWSGDPPPVQPPEPGAPGGLPDDRTPISEAPFTPDSAQGAANVVQTFYAHLSAGKAGEASKLMRGASPPDLDSYWSYQALVGAPGEIEGAAGSLFVRVPVVIYGRLRTGQPIHQSGDAVLRRSNDVPGATAEQRAWRIERIELR